MKKNSQAFVNELVVCLILTIGLGSSVGVGMVWMRHQISTTANKIRALKAEAIELDRLATAKSAEIAIQQSPLPLRNLNDQFRLGLVPWNDVPVINESSDVAMRGLIERNSADLVERTPTVSFKIARN